MADLPTGTVTFLLTDIEDSTRLWEQHPEAMRLALVRHDALIATGIEQSGGVVVKSQGEGDSVFAVFARASDAVAAACALQRVLLGEPWPERIPVRVRMALHTGDAALREGDYFGAVVNRCARLRAVAHGGQVLLSLATEEVARDSLPQGVGLVDLGVHRLQDLSHPERIFQLVHADLPSEFPPLQSLDALPNNLPLQLTSFVGRSGEKQEVRRHLAASRLVTLTGAGGCGKTRLALQVAAELLDEFRDGVWLVELAALSDATLVPQSVASALGIREEPWRPLTETLFAYERPRSLLLVLDGCEHLLSACAWLADALLRACPNLHIMATSREGLGVAGEQTYRVPSLTLPDATHLPPLERLHEFEAVRLFTERAALSQPSFVVTKTNWQAVAQVCQRLDGIPLALELAAARVKALPVGEIAARLDDCFRLLTGGGRTALPRHQTLRALIDWSYDLLLEPQRTLLRRLSVFSGGWVLEAAEVVCAGDGLEQWEVMDLLTTLVEKSLVQYEERDGKARYRLLETVRQYAQDRLVESRTAAVMRERHLTFYAGLAEEAEPELHGIDQGAWLDRLETEHDNLRAALEWSVKLGRTEQSLRMAAALWPFWRVRGYWTEGRRKLAEALALPGAPEHPAARAKALQGAGALAWAQGDFSLARSSYEESLGISRQIEDERGVASSLQGMGSVASREGNLTLARSLLEESIRIDRKRQDERGLASGLSRLGQVISNQGNDEFASSLFAESFAIRQRLGDKGGMADSLTSLGNLALFRGHYSTARACYTESLAILQQLDSKRELANILNNLGHVAQQEEDYDAARSAHEESLAIRRDLGDRTGIAMSLSNLGEVARYQRQFGLARDLLEQSLAMQRDMGDKVGIGYSLVNLGYVAGELGDPETAHACYTEGLAIWRSLGKRNKIADCLNGLARIIDKRGNLGQAARLLGAVEVLREATGSPLPPAERTEYQGQVAALRAALGDDAFAAAWAEGRTMTLEQALELALEEPSTS